MAAPHAERMTSTDASFLYLERKEAPMHIGAVGILEGELPYEEYARNIEAKLGGLPRFRQKVVATPFFVGHPTWETDTEFDVFHHVKLHRLPAPGREAQLQAVADEIIAQRLDRSRPLWELHVVHGLEGSHSAIVSKVHHAMVDGVGGNEILTTILDLNPHPEPRPAHPEPPPTEPLGDRDRIVEALWDNALTTLDSLSEYQRSWLEALRSWGAERAQSSFEVLRTSLPELALPPRRLPFNRPCSGQRRFTWTRFSFAEARAVRAALGGTVNDVILTCLAGAVTHYCQHHGTKTADRTMRVMVPVNVRPENEGASLGNLVSVLPVDVPLDIEDPAHRLGVIREATLTLKRGRVADGISMMSRLLGVVPVPFQAAFGAMAASPFPIFNIVCTNVPGPQIPLYGLGRPLVAYYPYVPVGFDLGVGCAVFSYNQTLFVGLNSDTSACPDVEVLRRGFDEAVTEIKQAARVGRIERVDTTRRRGAKRSTKKRQAPPARRKPSAKAGAKTTARRRSTSRSSVE